LETVLILVIASLYGLFGVALSRLRGSYQRNKEITAQINDYNDQLKQADKNPESKAQIQQQLAPAVQQLICELMVLPWRTIFFTVPLLILLVGANGYLGVHFEGFLKMWFPNFSIQLPIALHWDEITHLRIFSWSAYGCRGFFLFGALFANLAINYLFGRFENAEINTKEDSNPTKTP
jgi:hypothetical protein